MTTTTAQLSRTELLEALEAIDQRTIESINAHREGRDAKVVPLPRAAQAALDAGSDEETYEDLPPAVLSIFQGDKNNNDQIGEVNEGATKSGVQDYRDEKLTKEQLEEQLKTKDEHSVQELQQQLKESREKLADELSKHEAEVQQKGLRGRDKSNGGLNGFWTNITDEVSNWFKKLIEQVVEWFKGAFQSIADFFAQWFKF
ncbi:hypothetical protein ACIOML_28600 [Streptomyces anulatus]